MIGTIGLGANGENGGGEGGEFGQIEREGMGKRQERRGVWGEGGEGGEGGEEEGEELGLGNEGSKTATSAHVGLSSDINKPCHYHLYAREKAQAQSRRGSSTNYGLGYPQPTTPNTSSSYPKALTTRAWYQFDLTVVVALVSPIGNWLAGRGHI
ncbi:hypothetical protein BJ165DRAFT_1407068 [Panaeolus papilionaceus]|nr:hypothetical protein BJ165DRAFT_1407068 [Panaeolus papilionaceus]